MYADIKLLAFGYSLLNHEIWSTLVHVVAWWHQVITRIILALSQVKYWQLHRKCTKWLWLFCCANHCGNPPIFSMLAFYLLYPPHNEVVGGVYWFHSVRPFVHLSVRPSVRPSRMPCPLCIIYSYGWILFILGTNDHYHERVCRAPWPLTLTYIFKVIWPWLRKSCPLCSIYSSGWILSIFGTNEHYH